MRIISGIHKGRRFYPPKSFDARPTTDFAKENLFNVLSNTIDWEDVESALDLFSGTGGISFELVSREVKRVTCIEKNRNHADFIQKTKETLRSENLTLIRGDVFKYLENSKQQFDFIFADPPYDLKNFEKVPQLIIEGDMIKEGGIFILEHPKAFDFEELPLFSEKRVYGSVNFSIFRKS